MGDSPLGYFAKRRKADIELPNTSGKQDTRLKKQSVLDGFSNAAKGLDFLRKKKLTVPSDSER
jgi:hypothetical protein